jgi:CRISPR-associated protein (TIGR03986 family)
MPAEHTGHHGNRPQNQRGPRRDDHFRNRGSDGGGHRGGGDRRPHDSGPAIETIPSPYNFVATDPQVAKADTVGLNLCHDTPFQDGWSGYIELKIEATTPIYTRAAGDFRAYRSKSFSADCRALVGTAREQCEVGRDLKGRDLFKAFTDCYRIPDGRPAIPSTSLRGVVRNLIEMLTNSRLGPVNDRKYAVRDLNNPDRSLYGNWMSDSSSGSFEPRVRAGWLSAKGDEWFITPCELARVEQEDLERFAGHVRLGGRGTLERKYQAWLKARMSTAMQWQIDQLTGHRHSGGKTLRYRKAMPVQGQGTGGTLVFTGQPMDRLPGRPGRKHLEFVFFDEAKDPVLVDPAQRRTFLQTHTDASDRPSESWTYWKSKLGAGERIPVFYLAYPTAGDAKPGQRTVAFSNATHLHSFGLALMFRLAYKLTLKEAIPQTHRETPGSGKMDFTEALFGYQRDKEDDGLRSRLAFGPCIADRDAHQLPPVITVLGGPKPTYYPNYLKQPYDPANPRRLGPDKHYRTLMDADGQTELRGWKFYPAHPDKRDPGPGLPLPPAKENGERNYDTATAFRPLAAGTTFTGRLRFHNLRPAELGALVWALTWGGDSTLRHRIGMAKPLGYGCAKISIAGAHLVPNDPEKGGRVDWNGSESLPSPLAAALSAFKDLFQNRLSGPDIQNDLLRMAQPDHGVELRYPRLEQRNNEFAEAKRDKLVLPQWRVLSGGGAAYAVGQVVACEVTKRQEEKQKASLHIVGGKVSDSGGLHPNAKARFGLIPAVGQTVNMKIVNAGAGSFQFDFPDAS